MKSKPSASRKGKPPADRRLGKIPTLDTEVVVNPLETPVPTLHARTEQAESRTEQARTRTERAEAGTEEAETSSEGALRASERNYRRLFEAARDGILILDTDTGSITDVNPYLMSMLGFSHQELVGKPIWDLGPFKDIVSNKAKFEQLQNEGYLRYDNLALETKAGLTIAVEVVSSIHQAGDRLVIQCTMHDITARKRAEHHITVHNEELERRIIERTSELRNANQELQTTNAELEAFNFTVSHDLRAPLRHIEGFANILQEKLGPSMTEDNRRYLCNISQGASKMGTLIDNLLNFSRIGKAEVKKNKVNLDELLRDVLSDFELHIKDRDICWDISPLPIVQADCALLRMVLVNLISNALKFTAKRPKTKIEVGRSLSTNAGETVIFIRDNGAGFNAKYAVNLFSPFERMHAAGEFEGTGIGLANVRRIINRHGGKTWADGEVDKGATFYFSLPEHQSTSPNVANVRRVATAIGARGKAV